MTSTINMSTSKHTKEVFIVRVDGIDKEFPDADRAFAYGEFIDPEGHVITIIKRTTTTEVLY